MAKAKSHALPKGKSKAKAKPKSSLAKGKALLAKQKSLTKGKDSTKQSLAKGKAVNKDILKKIEQSCFGKIRKYEPQRKILTK